MRRAPRAALVGLLLAMSAGACRHDASGVPHAQAIVADDGRFGNGPSSGDAFSSAAGSLFAAAQHCERSGRSVPAPACVALFEAAADAQATGVHLLGCTAPGVFDARQRWRAYLAKLARFERRPVGDRPTLPMISPC